MDNILITNRKAYKDFAILDKYEAGIVLTGPEVKSLRLRRGNLADCYAHPFKGELWLTGFHISPYDFATRENLNPVRERKLLLHKKEIEYLAAQVMKKGFSIVPLQVYLKNGRFKVEVALAKGKFQIDKREDIKRKTAQREADRAMKNFSAKRRKSE